MTIHKMSALLKLIRVTRTHLLSTTKHSFFRQNSTMSVPKTDLERAAAARDLLKSIFGQRVTTFDDDASGPRLALRAPWYVCFFRLFSPTPVNHLPGQQPAIPAPPPISNPRPPPKSAPPSPLSPKPNPSLLCAPPAITQIRVLAALMKML